MSTTIDITKSENLNSIVYDLLEGDMDIYTSYLKEVDFDKIKTALNYILSLEDTSTTEKMDLLNNSWRILYKQKPPTAEEFLSPRYLGQGTSDSIFPRVKKAFLEFADPTKPYRNAVLAPFISYGKSYLCVLWNLYTTTHLALMHDAKKYFGLIFNA